MPSAATPQLEVTGSGDRFRLEAARRAAASVPNGDNIEITGEIPEVPKGKSADVLLYNNVVKK
jgi:lysophospholipid acyltransferase (LPLAT)-like uncharacterized protein